MRLLQNLNNPTDDTTLDHRCLGSFPETKFLKSSKSVLSQVRIIVTLSVESLYQHRDNVVILEQVWSTLILISKTVEKGDKILLDFYRLRVKENLEDALRFVGLILTATLVNLKQIKVDERCQNWSSHRGWDSSQTPPERLKSCTNVSFIGCLSPEECLQFLEI